MTALTRLLFQYVKQETQTSGEHGLEARATRLITERASRRIGQMAFELARSRPRKVRLFHDDNGFRSIHLFHQHLTIIHKSNVLSVTDGLFRETVRNVPRLPENDGKYDEVEIAEQLVDSAVYRYAQFAKHFVR